MDTLVIVNPAAGSAQDAAALEREVASREGWALRHTGGAGDGARLAAEAIEAGAGLVVACGGDGTIHDVVQGLVRRPDRARLGVVPLGTANDLARTLDLPPEPEAAIALIDSGEQRDIDVLRVESDGQLRYCVNVAASGFGGEVDRVVHAGELKDLWGPLAYIVGAVEAAGDLQAYDATIEIDDAPPETVPALAVTVANGRTCGGGLHVAPWADLEDGLLDVTVFRDASVLELGGLAARLAAGTVLESEGTLHRRGRRATLRSEPPVWLDVDGELFTQRPVTLTVVPRALRVTVGPGYRREPEL